MKKVKPLQIYYKCKTKIKHVLLQVSSKHFSFCHYDVLCVEFRSGENVGVLCRLSRVGYLGYHHTVFHYHFVLWLHCTDFWEHCSHFLVIKSLTWREREREQRSQPDILLAENWWCILCILCCQSINTRDSITF